MSETRAKFLSIAAKYFSEKGFYGASIANISAELNLSKQALLHHFGSKEALYAEVLKEISASLIEGLEDTLAAVDDPKDRTITMFCAIYREAIHNRQTTRLLVRELLDNRQRADTAKSWYLKPFLERLIEVVQSDPRAAGINEHDALLLVYQVLGAIHYFLISKPTLTQMFGKRTYASLEQNHEAEIGVLLTARLDALKAQNLPAS